MLPSAKTKHRVGGTEFGGIGNGRSGFNLNLLDREHGHVRRINAFDVGFIALGAALNVSIGYLVSVLKLPLYLDSIGTILVSVLCGWVYGLVVGLSALIILTLTVVPTVIAYAGTAAVIAIASALLARIGFLKSIKMTLLGGLIVGVCATATSVPVTLFYGGVTLAGSDAVTTVFKVMGLPLWESVLFGSLMTDVLDKIVTAMICLMLVRSLPPRMLSRFTGRGNSAADGHSRNRT